MGHLDEGNVGIGSHDRQEPLVLVNKVCVEQHSQGVTARGCPHRRLYADALDEEPMMRCTAIIDSTSGRTRSE